MLTNFLIFYLFLNISYLETKLRANILELLFPFVSLDKGITDGYCSSPTRLGPSHKTKGNAFAKTSPGRVSYVMGN